MGQGYNPYRQANGRFGSGPKKIQYSQSDEWKDVAETNEDQKQDQMNQADIERERLRKETEIRDIDLRIGELEREIAYQQERYAGAWSEDDRKSAEQQIKLCKKAIRNLNAKKKQL